MDYPYLRYAENLPEEFSIKHKITKTTEKKNFHLHKQLEIVFALSGNLKCKFETGVVPIPANGMILFNQMDLHYLFFEEGSDLCDRYVLYFSSNYISHFSTPEINLLECFLLRPTNQPMILTVSETQLDQFLSLLQKMDDYNSPKGSSIPHVYGKDLHLKFLLGEFLLCTNQLYLEHFGPLNSTSYRKHAQLVYNICEYIGSHYNTSLNIDGICKLFAISKTQLYHIFKEISGMTISDYITEYRILKAKDFLINTDHSVEIISQDVGYTNISSFSRIFKCRTGYSPIQYRKKHESMPE